MNVKNKFLALVPVALLATASALFGTVPEPSTILYGQVLHRAHGNEHKLTEGTLEWTLRDELGAEFIYTTELADIKDVFSYKVSISHQALSSGLEVDPTVIPLGLGETNYEFVSITVDGYPAAILWSEVDYLELIQNSRAATHRIDLLVSFDMLDTDGDGMPDWWEKFHGLNWQLNDADLDPDGDGWSHLEEYFNGTDPFFDNRTPTLQTLNLAAFGESNNGVWLRSIDADTDPQNIVYTVVSMPEGGHLHRMYADAPESGDEALGAGSTFTQDDLNQGRIAYRHTVASTTEASFEVTLSDGVYQSEITEVHISVFPSSTLEDLDEVGTIPFWWRDENVIFEAYWGLRENVLSGDLVESALLFLLGKDYGWTLWDQRAETLPVILETSGSGSHIVLGGAANDILGGGAGSDILNGGLGQDQLTGGGDVDMFTIVAGAHAVITDFSISEDVLDLGAVVSGLEGAIADYVELLVDGSDTVISVHTDGDFDSDATASARLQGVLLNNESLNGLWSEGQLLLGELEGEVTVEFEVWPSANLEEGYNTLEVVLSRNGPTHKPLTVELQLTGPATNGSDYKFIDEEVIFEIGQSSVTLEFVAYTDSLLEGGEVIDVRILPLDGYVLGTVASGTLTVVDARQRFSLHAFQETAVVGGQPGTFVIQRYGPSNTEATVYLQKSGSGIENTDYVYPQVNYGFVQFASGVTSMPLPVVALANGALAEPETSRTVSLGLLSDWNDSYVIDESSSATIRLLSDQAAFESWVAELEAAGELSGSGEVAEEEVSSRSGINALLEYALSYGVDFEDGLNAEERSQMTPQIFQTAQGMEVEFTQRLNDASLSYTLECSPDLVNWHSGAEHFESIDLGEDAENSGRVRYRVIGSDETNCFVRVVVKREE